MLGTSHSSDLGLDAYFLMGKYFSCFFSLSVFRESISQKIPHGGAWQRRPEPGLGPGPGRWSIPYASDDDATAVNDPLPRLPPPDSFLRILAVFSLHPDATRPLRRRARRGLNLTDMLPAAPLPLLRYLGVLDLSANALSGELPVPIPSHARSSRSTSPARPQHAHGVRLELIRVRWTW